MCSERRVYSGEIEPIMATQSGTLYRSEKNFGADNAVDNYLKTQAGVEALNGRSWLKFKFDQRYFIKKIVIYWKFYTDWYHRNAWCSRSVPNFRRCADMDTGVDVSVYQGEVKQKSCGTLQLTYGLEQSDQIYTLLCNAEGDTVQLSKDSGNIAVYEVVTIAEGKS